MTETLRITFEQHPAEDVQRFIVEGVDAHNMAITGLSEFYPVNFVLRGERDDVLGGFLGLLWGSWLHVSHLWVSGAARNSGHGSRLLGHAEDYARSRGAIGSTLETYSFQAKPFYERQGYEVFGALEGFPPGHVKFVLKKLFV